MNKKIVGIACFVFTLCLISATVAFAVQSTNFGTKAKAAVQKIVQYPANIAKESVDVVAETGKKQANVIAKEGRRTGEVITGDLAKTKEMITEPLTGTAETAVKAVEGTVNVPVEAAKDKTEADATEPAKQ